MMYSVEKAVEALVKMRGKIGMETNKALVLNERGHNFFSFFSLNKFHSLRTKSVQSSYWTPVSW